MKKKYLSQESVENYIHLIYLNIIEANWKPDIILSINRGGCTPGIYLSHYLGKPHEVINIELRDSNIEPDLISIKEKTTNHHDKTIHKS